MPKPDGNDCRNSCSKDQYHLIGTRKRIITKNKNINRYQNGKENYRDEGFKKSGTSQRYKIKVKVKVKIEIKVKVKVEIKVKIEIKVEIKIL